MKKILALSVFLIGCSCSYEVHVGGVPVVDMGRPLNNEIVDHALNDMARPWPDLYYDWNSNSDTCNSGCPGGGTPGGHSLK